jgi:hypothetical protein
VENQTPNPNLTPAAPIQPMPAQPPRYWWRTRAFKIGLGVLAVVAVTLAVLFGDQIAKLLDLFGTRAGQERLITISGQVDPNLPAYLGNGTFNGTIFESGAVILIPPQ